jgi:putative NIF3 family GTP cyclohydrolase 1 type 2
MTKAIEIINFLNDKYPENLRAEWDVVDAYLEGDKNKEVHKIGIGLELNKEFLDKNFDMIILHHPPKFGKDRVITNPFYDKLNSKPTIYILHSRIDVKGDLNRSLALNLFKDSNVEKVLDDGTVIASLPKEIGLLEMVDILKTKLNKKTIKLIKKKNKISRIAIHGGEGFNKHHVEKAVNEGIDAYLAGDLTHHLAESAHFYNVTFIDIEHVSEKIGMNDLCNILKMKFPDCNFKYINKEPYWETL